MKKYIQSYRLFFGNCHLRTDSTVRDNRLLPYE